mgnify:CR=1 FL=1
MFSTLLCDSELAQTSLVENISDEDWRGLVKHWSDPKYQVNYIYVIITCWTPIYGRASQIYLLEGELFKDQAQRYESEIPTDDNIS